MPKPASSIGQVTFSGPAPASSAATMMTIPANSAKKPDPHDAAGRSVREQLGNTHGGQKQRDRQRQEADAGRDRRKPQSHRQVLRHREEQASLQQVLEAKRGEPAAQGPVP
jgi:hypothetical protein